MKQITPTDIQYLNYDSVNYIMNAKQVLTGVLNLSKGIQRFKLCKKQDFYKWLSHHEYCLTPNELSPGSSVAHLMSC